MVGFQVTLLFSVALVRAFPSGESKPRYGIVGGDPIDISKVPHQVSLLKDGNNLFCGGSIISESFVLTAAHCCWDSDLKLGIHAGSNVFYAKNGSRYTVEKIIIHPKYDPNTSLYDACLVKPKEKIEFNENVKPIKMADEEPQPEELAQVTGWGVTSEGGELSKVLLAASVPVVNKTYCHSAYPFIYNIELCVCAGQKGKDSCQGDSGGALTLKDRQVGIVSFGQGCARESYPGVYTNIAHPEVRSFIKSVAGV